MERSSPIRLARTTAVAAALSLGAAHLAMATPVTFAQYVQGNGATQQWSLSTVNSVSTITGSGAVFFSFSGLAGLPFAGPEMANFSITATSSMPGACGDACVPGDAFTQAGYSGTFSFIDAGAAPGTNLLSGVFTTNATPASGAQFSSHIGSSGGSFNASSNINNLNQLHLTSTYLNFAGQTDENASFSLSSLIPNFFTGAVVNNQAYPGAGPFTAAGSGTFSSNPGPTVATVPEPSSLAIFGVGLLALGFVVRRGGTAARAMARHSLSPTF
jgi:hypothetical protein